MYQYKNLAVYGGTFDPIHYGHLLVAEQVYDNFSVEKILFMPAGDPPHKINREITDARHRYRMIQLAIEGNENFLISDYELKKGGKSYTADTLRYFKENRIAENLYFIIGADSLLDIFDWREPEFLLQNAYFIVAGRPGYQLKEVMLEEKYKPYLKQISFLDTIEVGYSSSRIRVLLKEGKSIKYQTPDLVIEYIEEHHLYRR